MWTSGTLIRQRRPFYRQIPGVQAVAEYAPRGERTSRIVVGLNRSLAPTDRSPRASASEAGLIGASTNLTGHQRKPLASHFATLERRGSHSRTGAGRQGMEQGRPDSPSRDLLRANCSHKRLEGLELRVLSLPERLVEREPTVSTVDAGDRRKAANHSAGPTLTPPRGTASARRSSHLGEDPQQRLGLRERRTNCRSMSAAERTKIAAVCVWTQVNGPKAGRASPRRNSLTKRCKPYRLR